MGADPQDASVLVAGAGNIGSHLAPLLARAGVGRLRIVDRDIVEEKNLRQQDYGPQDVGRGKAEALARRLAGQFPQLRVEPFVADLEDVPLGSFRVTVLFGALDSRRARQILVSERGWPLGVPVIDGGVGEGLLGRVQTFVPGPASACLECTWGEADYRQLAAEYPCQPGAAASAPATMAPACVGAVVAGIMAARFLNMLAAEPATESREIAFDLRHNRFLESRLRRSARCRFDHVVSEVVHIAAEALVADLVALIERRFGARPAHVEGVGQAAGLPSRGRPAACPTGGFAPTRFLPVEALRDQAAEPVSALSIVPGNGVRVRSGSESIFVMAESGGG
ncbi:MAG TPA: ThiF family adenylyltransferase [Gemmataceae bacterium]|nr:ThiF family adenylyltransferase [Gemmataceae bacterium]